MTSISDESVCIQTSSEAVPAAPSWFGEVVLISSFLRTHNVLSRSPNECALHGSVLGATT